ncbi:Flp family type IVb pilin [Hydrocarboniphaga effusa]|uniref:Flp family type IVb pilin n=1 Tax=Hydrocarboniphaga effusa TaxID=243629 RepID=UPI003137961F
MKHYLKAVSRAKQEGATAIEYALIAGLIVLAIAVTLGLLSGNLDTLFGNVNTQVQGASTP